MSMRFPSSRSCSSYASILCAQMLEANRDIPFDADSFFEEIADGEMPAPCSHLPLQSLELASQHSVQIQSPSTAIFNQVAPFSHLQLQSSELVNQPSIQIQSSSSGPLCNPSNSWRVGVPSSFPDIGHSAGTSISSSLGNSVWINQLSTFVASFGHVPTFGSEDQNQMARLLGRTTPMIGFSGQVAPINFGSSAMPVGSSALDGSSSDGPAMPNQIPNDGDAIVSLPGGGTVDQQAVLLLVITRRTAVNCLQEQARHRMGPLMMWMTFWLTGLINLISSAMVKLSSMGTCERCSASMTNPWLLQVASAKLLYL